VISYSYDGLQRLIGAAEAPGSTYAYSYDVAGNRTDGGKTYNAANQITNAGYTYDNAGNLTGDGTATYTYDALSRMTARGATTSTYNGDGTLVYDGATRYTQDLVSPLTQVLQTTQGSATTHYLYGLDRLAAVTGSNRTWYSTDALGSVRQMLSDTAIPLGVVNYDPWGTPESGTVPTFGFTGELQDAATGLVNLRARWYSTASGTFTAFRWRTSESSDTTPYSHHPYAYALSNPILLTDPSGRCSETGRGDDYCHTDNPASTNTATPIPLAAGVAGVAGLTLVGEGSSGAIACAVVAPCIIIAGAAGELLYFTLLPNAAEHRQDLARGLAVCGQWLEDIFREQPTPIALTYTVNPHAYGRRTGNHAKDEAEIRATLKGSVEWWYNPTQSAATGQELFAGLAGPITGPIAVVRYNATTAIVNTFFYQAMSLDEARQYIYSQGYIVPVLIAPIS